MTDPTQASMETALKLVRFNPCEDYPCHELGVIDSFGQGCSCLGKRRQAAAIARALLLAKSEGMREAADWLESNGQPGYAIELRARALELEQAAERIAP
jgi:hypothetical protein